LENGVGTNPEELIAATHAGCFPMFSTELGEAGITPESVRTKATTMMEGSTQVSEWRNVSASDYLIS
jgi:organic hydroperoxide reductase OsmC/OhrA